MSYKTLRKPLSGGIRRKTRIIPISVCFYDRSRILESVQRSKSEAHEETMWGKPARDIVTGIGNNNGVAPVRAIWELVQNARDVTSDGRKSQNCVYTQGERTGVSA